MFEGFAAIMGIKPPVRGPVLRKGVPQETHRAACKRPEASHEVRDFFGFSRVRDERAGLDGVVSSPQEIQVIHEYLPGWMKIITPGIRPVWAVSQDQKRIMTPADAISAGAYALVIGRAITKPPAEIGDPVTATNMIKEEIAAALP